MVNCSSYQQALDDLFFEEYLISLSGVKTQTISDDLYEANGCTSNLQESNQYLRYDCKYQFEIQKSPFFNNWFFRNLRNACGG